MQNCFVEVLDVIKITQVEWTLLRIKIQNNTKPKLEMKLIDDSGKQWKIKSIETHGVPSLQFYQKQEQGFWGIGVTPINHTREIEKGIYELIE